MALYVQKMWYNNSVELYEKRYSRNNIKGLCYMPSVPKNAGHITHRSVVLRSGVFVLEEKGSMDKINVLGTEYSVEYKTEIDDVGLVGLKGYCDSTSKRIVLRKAGERSPMDADKPELDADATVRHEIVHAFLFESGLSEYSHDETLVEWIAVQFPKMLDVLSGMGCLG